MPARLLLGGPLAEKILRSVRKEVTDLKKKTGRVPCLANIRIGNHYASARYEEAQRRRAESLGIQYRSYSLPLKATQPQVIALIRRLNRDRNVTGILLEVPLPKHLDPRTTLYAMNPDKDVEGIHPKNLGEAIYRERRFGSCTALAVIALIKSCGVALYGREAVIVGSSDLVGKPTSLMVVDSFATTTVCHIGTSRRGNLKEHVKRAEILVVAVGQPNLVKGSWIRKGAIVVDVGINYHKGRMVGDVGFKEARKRASYITPVPGGVGPLVSAILMQKVVEAFRRRLKR